MNKVGGKFQMNPHLGQSGCLALVHTAGNKIHKSSDKHFAYSFPKGEVHVKVTGVQVLDGC